ncbi:MAG: hypothetical protein QOC86_2260 [Gaiellales bacterium]|nr:hypothetical protein [Gaiellales bacterium]
MSAGVPAVDRRNRIVELLAAEILVVDGRELTGRDLLAAGVLSGRWQQLERELTEGLGLVAAQPPAEAEVARLLREFRFERGLLSADDLRAWMGARALTLAAVKSVLARSLARDAGGTPRAVDATQVAAALPAEAICSGALRAIGLWLADRMLSTATTRETDVAPLALERSSVQRLVFEEARTVAGAASPEAGTERARRLAWIAALDEAHGEWEAGSAGTADVQRRLHEKELEWCRYELDELGLGSPGAAAEAARQLAEGRDPAQVAEVAGVALATRTAVLADAPAELARVLTGAIVGDVIGPWSDDSVHVVARVRVRRPPDIADEPSVARAREELLTDMATRLRAGRVRWHERT